MKEGNDRVTKEQITWQPISCYETTDKLFHVHSLRFYLCLWFCNVNLKEEIKETGREIRKGNPPPPTPRYLCAAYTSGATYTQFADSCALRCVLRGKSQFPVATGCADSVAFRVGQKRSPEIYSDVPNAAWFRVADAGVGRRGEGLIVVLVTSRKGNPPKYFLVINFDLT